MVSSVFAQKAGISRVACRLNSEGDESQQSLYLRGIRDNGIDRQIIPASIVGIKRRKKRHEEKDDKECAASALDSPAHESMF